MTHKSDTQPFCRCCGRAIPKATEGHYFTGGDNAPEPPKTREDAQRVLNGRIVSLAYWGEGDRRHVYRASTWDGESYADALFCREPCAAAFGRMAATHYPALETVEAHAARQKRMVERSQ